MPIMAKVRSIILGAACLLVAVSLLEPVPAAAASSSAIKAIVNGTVITAGDVQRRVAFLRLRRTAGNLQQKAVEELVNEQLMRAEIIRTGSSISTDDVEAAFVRFAASNKMSPKQLTDILSRAGVGADHFKAYIGIQMSWPKTVQARFGSNRMTAQDLVTRLKQDNGKKPSTTEYILQQVIFVVPENRRAKITGKRKSEAEASRKSYPGCAGAKAFARGYHDVSIRNIGRIMQPQLPSEWKAMIEKTAEGGTTGTLVTEKGVEYLAVCKKREVSDDFAAQVVYEAQDLEKAEAAGENPNSKKYIEELRKLSQVEIR